MNFLISDKVIDNEIIKALECCTKLRYDIQQPPACVNCPYYNLDDCTFELKNNTLALINRQKAEIESLKRRLHNAQLHQEETYKALLKEQQLRRLAFSEDFIKAEAIKEFTERLKQNIDCDVHTSEGFYFMVQNVIDNLVKEMVGGNDDL